MTRATVVVFFLAVVCWAVPVDPQPVGELISIGSRKLHIRCTGSGSPTVIVENGGAVFSFDWGLLQGNTRDIAPSRRYFRGRNYPRQSLQKRMAFLGVYYFLFFATE